MVDWLGLPIDIFRNCILDYLDVCSIRALILTCHRLKTIFDAEPTWKIVCCRYVDTTETPIPIWKKFCQLNIKQWQINNRVLNAVCKLEVAIAWISMKPEWRNRRKDWLVDCGYYCVTSDFPLQQIVYLIFDFYNFILPTNFDDDWKNIEDNWIKRVNSVKDSMYLPPLILELRQHLKSETFHQFGRDFQRDFKNMMTTKFDTSKK